jgi:hypothetical protein
VQVGEKAVKINYLTLNMYQFIEFCSSTCTYFFVQVALRQPRSFPSFFQPSGKLREKFPFPNLFPKNKNGAIK